MSFNRNRSALSLVTEHGKQLAQVRENSTNPVSVYNLPVKTTAVIRFITICNNSGSNAAYRLFHDDNGTTYDESTALAWDIELSADSSDFIEVFYPMNNPDGNFAYRSSVANAITITLSGDEMQ